MKQFCFNQFYISVFKLKMNQNWAFVSLFAFYFYVQFLPGVI